MIQEQAKHHRFSHAMFTNIALCKSYTITIIGKSNIYNIGIEW